MTPSLRRAKTMVLDLVNKHQVSKKLGHCKVCHGQRCCWEIGIQFCVMMQLLVPTSDEHARRDMWDLGARALAFRCGMPVTDHARGPHPAPKRVLPCYAGLCLFSQHVFSVDVLIQKCLVDLLLWKGSENIPRSCQKRLQAPQRLIFCLYITFMELARVHYDAACMVP